MDRRHALIAATVTIVGMGAFILWRTELRHFANDGFENRAAKLMNGNPPAPQTEATPQLPEITLPPYENHNPELDIIAHRLAAADSPSSNRHDATRHYRGLLQLIHIYYGTSGSCSYTNAIETIYYARQWWPDITYLYCLEQLIAEIPRDFQYEYEYIQFTIDYPQIESNIRTSLWTNAPQLSNATLEKRWTLCSVAQTARQWAEWQHWKIFYERQTIARQQQEIIYQNIQKARQRGQLENERREYELRQRQQYAEEQMKRLQEQYWRQVQYDQNVREQWQYQNSGRRPTHVQLIPDETITTTPTGRTSSTPHYYWVPGTTTATTRTSYTSRTYYTTRTYTYTIRYR